MAKDLEMTDVAKPTEEKKDDKDKLPEKPVEAPPAPKPSPSELLATG